MKINSVLLLAVIAALLAWNGFRSSAQVGTTQPVEVVRITVNAPIAEWEAKLSRSGKRVVTVLPEGESGNYIAVLQ